MANTAEDVRRLEKEFKACRKILTALGDDTLRHLRGSQLGGGCDGSRVRAIAEQKTDTCPAVSHQMQIVKDAGVGKSRTEGTCIYYYLDPEASQINALITVFCDIREFMKEAPDRSGADE